MAESSTKKRKNRRGGPTSRHYRRPPVTAILLLGGFVFVVLAFITFRQIRAGETNRLRLLAGFASQVETTVPDLVERFINVVENTADGAGVDRVPNLELVQGPVPAEEGERAGLQIVANGPRIYLRYVTPVKRDIATTEETGATERPVAAAIESIESELAVPPAVPPDANPRPRDEKLAVYVARLDLPSVVQPIVIPEVFDLIVLARQEDGVVLFQHGERELKLARVEAAWEVQRPGLIDALRDVWQDAPAPPPSGGGTRVTETEIADIDHRVFVQPVTLRFYDTEGNPLGKPIRWVACGVISWERLLSSSFTTSPLLLFILVALFPLMLVLWPFLKTWLTSRHQALTRFDISALVFAAMLGVSLASFLLLDFAFQSRLRTTVNGQLEELAGALEVDFHREIEDAAEQLQRYRDSEDLAREFAAPPEAKAGSGSSIWEEITQRLRSSPSGRKIVPVANPATADPLEPATTGYYRPVHSVFWTDRAGFQESKIPFHPDGVLRNRVDDRAYFTCHQRGPFRDQTHRDAVEIRLGIGDGETFCLQSIRSKTTAGDLAVLTLPRRDADAQTAIDQKRGVVALVTRLVSFTDPLLAPGFKFAVIRNDGRVLFHSDPRRNTVEDFLKATGDDPILSAMLAEGRAGPLKLNYWGSLYLAYVRPMGDLPWSLVTLRSKRDLRTRNFELLYDFLNPFLLYLLVANLLFFLGLWLLSRKSLRYLWPSRSFSPTYRLLFLTTTPWLGLAALGVVARDPRRQVAIALLVPLGALLVAVFGFWVRPRLDRLLRDQQRLQGWRRVLVAWFEGLLRGFRQERTRGWSRVLVAWLEHGIAEWLVLVAGCAMAVGAVVHSGGGDRVVGGFLAFAALAAAVAYTLLRRSFVDRTTTAPYTAALCTLLLLGAVVPTAALFRLAESRQSQLLVQDGQRGLLLAAASRTRTLAEEAGPLARYLPRYWPTFDDFPASTARAFFHTRAATPADEGSPPLWPYGEADAGRAPRFLVRLLAARPVPLDELAPDSSGTDLTRFPHLGTHWSLRGPRRGELRATMDPPTESTSIRGSGTGPWFRPSAVVSSFAGLSPLAEQGPLRFALFTLGLVALGVLIVALTHYVASRVLLIALAPNRRYAAIRKILDQVKVNGRRAQQFLVVTSLPEALVQVASGSRYEDKFHIVPFAKRWAESGEGTAGLRAFTHPMDRHEPPVDAAGATDANPRSLLITEFTPDLSDVGTARRQIETLRRLWSHNVGDKRRRSMLIVTSRSFHRLARPVAVDEEKGSESEREARRLWGAFLARFSQRYARDEGKRRTFEAWIQSLRGQLWAGAWPNLNREPDWFKTEDDWRAPRPSRASTGANPDWRQDRMRTLLDEVCDECKWTWRLQRVGIDIVRELFDGLPGSLPSAGEGGSESTEEPGLHWVPPTVQQLVERIGFAALPYYQRIWDSCEPGEKVVLYQLAHHGIANPKNFDQLLDLLNKGLVVREEDDPILRPLNRSFAAFVRKAVRHREAWRWEEEEGVSAWSVWKWVLPVPLLLLGLFLFVTQQNAVSNVVGLIVAAASLLPTAVNLYQHFRQAITESVASE